RLTVSISVAPLKKSATSVSVLESACSISTPNLDTGWLKVSVIDWRPRLESTRGVALSVSGGEPQLFQPPAGTVRGDIGAENETVSVPSVMELVIVPSAPVIAIRFVSAA